MLKLDLLQTDKHSTKICYAGKISDFYVAQILYIIVGCKIDKQKLNNIK